MGCSWGRGLVKTELYRLNLPSAGGVRIIAMMLPKTHITASLWLAVWALAAQGFGVPTLLEACRCGDCECGPRTANGRCCEVPATSPSLENCGLSCCQTPSRDCSQAAPALGSCCCGAAAPNAPANLPKKEPPSPKGPLPQWTPSVQAAAAPPANPELLLLTEVRHESPPLRVLYCVWRI